MELNVIHTEDCLRGLKTLPDDSVDCCVTSPPYFGLRDYGVAGQMGLESTPEEYVARMAEVFREVRRVLKPAGTLWLNIGDSYAGSGKGGQSAEKRSENWQPKYPKSKTPGLKPKDLIGIPWMLAFALRADGWYWRSTIIWEKPNVMPESVTDRPTNSHEYILFFSKSNRYYFDADAISEPAIKGASGSYFNIGKTAKHQGGRMSDKVRVQTEMRRKRSVWNIATQPLKDAHFATFPEKLIQPCIMAGCPAGGIVLDPFMGAGTAGLVAKKLGRNYIGFELNPEYVNIAERRINSILI